MVQYADAMLREWQPGEVRDLRREAMGVTFKIAAKTLFDAEADQDVDTIHDHFEQVRGEITVRFRRPFRIPDWIPFPGNPRYRRGVRFIDRRVARIVEERQNVPSDRVGHASGSALVLRPAEFPPGAMG